MTVWLLLAFPLLLGAVACFVRAGFLHDGRCWIPFACFATMGLTLLAVWGTEVIMHGRLL